MKTKKHLFVRLCFAVMMFVFSLGFVACKDDNTTKKPEPTPVDYGESGVYYFDADDGEYLVTLNGDSFALLLGNDSVAGTYTFDGENLGLVFADAAEALNAKLEDGVITLTYNNQTMRFLKKVNYTVSYNVNGGSAVADTTVLNGKTLAKPDDPTKEGCNFIGWYADSEFKTPFAFGATPILANTTVYARFETANPEQNEYIATYVVDDNAAYATQKTIGGVLYDLPTPSKANATFAGWWMSDYEDAEKLTCKYTGQTLTENATLYAVWQEDAALVSVAEDKITWEATGVNNSYVVTIKDSAGDVIKQETTSAVSYDFKFSELTAGDYTVEVSVNAGTAATAYVKHKALDKVSLFNVTEPSILNFVGVANAEKYLITVDCGNDDHNHTAVDNGTSTNYNFVNCDMQEGGITFVVEAQKAGWLSSVSETFVYSRDLEEVSGLKVDETTDQIVWNSVNNATSYVLEISQGDNTETYTLNTTDRYSLKGYTGELTIKVKPVAKGYNSPAATEITYTRAALAMPKNLRVEGATLRWDAVAGATGYMVKIGDKEYAVTTNELAFVEGTHYTSDSVVSAVSVQAVAADSKQNSHYSEAISVRYNGMVDELVYAQNTVYWEPIVSAARYAVRVNGEVVKTVLASEGVTSAAIILTQAGANTIEVCYYRADDEVNPASEWVAVEVFATEIKFDVRGGEAVDSIFVAMGDKVTLEETTFEGYDFAGWYNIPNGLKNNGKKIETGDVNEVFGGVMVYYAAWTPKAYSVSFDLDGNNGIMAEETFTVYYKQPFKLPLPIVDENGGIYFNGWFLSYDGQGTQYADKNGNGMFVWPHAYDLELHADWVELLKYELLNDGTYGVSKGRDIDTVSTITIPATYKGVEVSRIGSRAFADCDEMKTINIPDSIQTVYIGDDGSNGQPSAFYSCNYLASVNVYCPEAEDGVHVENSHENFYSSLDGMLVYHNPYTGKELKYVPASKTGSYQYKDVTELVIPEGVEIIPISLFKVASYETEYLTKVVIPSTVREIHASAFEYRDMLKEVVFAPVAEGAEAVALTIAKSAFNGCSSLLKVDLPGRLESLDSTAFNGCSALEEMNVVGEATNYSSVDGVLFDAAGTTLMLMPKGRGAGNRLDPADYADEAAYEAAVAAEATYTIPSKVHTIAENAFASCKNIKNITINRLIKEIGAGAFKSSGLTNLTFAGQKGDSLLNIGASAFATCTGLAYVELPANLGTLAAQAFSGTNSLSSVKVSGGANMKLEAGAFLTTSGTGYVKTLELGVEVPKFSVTEVFGSQKLMTIIVDKEENNPNFMVEDGVLFDEEQTEILFFPVNKGGDYTIPASVTKIGANVFQNRTKLTGVTIDVNVTEIGAYAFNGATALKTVVFKPVTEGKGKDLTIGDYAFKTCTAVKSFDLPTRLKSIGAHAFEGNKVVQYIIPEGVESIGAAAFQNNPNLTTVELPSTLTALGGGETMDVFNTCNALESILVSSDNTSLAAVDGILYKMKAVTTGEGDAAKTTYVPDVLYFSPLNNQGTDGVVTIPKTVTSILGNAFKENTGIKEVKFEKGIGTVTFGTNVFYKCTALETMSLPSGITELTRNFFYGCTALKEVYIPNTVTLVSYGAFSGSNALETVTFEDGKADGSSAAIELEDCSSSYSPSDGVFYGKAALKNVHLPLNRKITLGRGMFAKCSALTTIDIPSTVEVLPQYLFSDCTSLTTVNYLTREVKVGEGAEAKTTQVRDLKEIHGYAYQYCAALVNVVIPEGVESLGRWDSSESRGDPNEYPDTNMFYGCTALETVTLPASLKVIGSSAFYNLKALTSVTITDTKETPSQLIMIGYNSFYGSAIEEIRIPASIEIIDQYAFQKCESLTNVEFAVKNIKVGDKTYEDVSALQEIGTSAFQQSALTSFTFPETISPLRWGPEDESTRQFEQCASLAQLHLSSTVTHIDNVFNKCPALTKITIAEGNKNFKLHATLPLLMDYSETAICKIFGTLPEGTTIPSNLTKIADGAFAYRTDITEVIIPATVTTIEANAFAECTNLAKVTFLGDATTPSQLTSIGNKAFYKTALTKIELPASVTTLGSEVFAECTKLNDVTLPDGITDIGYKTFYKCSALKSIDLPTGLTYLSERLVSQSGITSIEIPVNVTKLYNFVFETCKSLTTITGGANIEEMGNAVFKGCTVLVSYTMPNSVETIGQNTFNGCTKLTSVTFSNKLKAIGNSTFSGCTALTTIVIPDSVETIGSSVFSGCTKLANVTLPKNLEVLGDSLFNKCTSLVSIALPQGLKDMGCKTFSGCTKLASITIPEGVTMLGDGTTCNYGTAVELFNGCTALTKVTLHNKLTKIASKIFYGCTKLTTVENTSGLTFIGNSAFYNTPLLASLDLSNVQDIGNNAFEKCGLTSVNLPNLTKLASSGSMFASSTKLKSVVLGDNLTTLEASMFKGCTALTSVKLPANLTALDSTAFQNCSALTAIEIPAGVTSIPATIFSGCTKLATVDMLGAIEVINSKAFEKCTSLTEIYLPESLTEIKANAFLGAGLTSITIPRAVHTIGNAAFGGCVGLTAISVSSSNASYEADANGVLYTTDGVAVCYPAGKSGVATFKEGAVLGAELFNGCANITGVELPLGMTEIPASAFKGMTGITTFVVPEGVMTIGNNAFENASKLVSIQLPESLTAIGNSAFKGCTVLETVNLPEGLVTIGTNAFENCKALTEITIPSTVTAFGNNTATSIPSTATFKGCSALTTVTISGNVEAINGTMFQDCTSLATINIPDTVTYIGSSAFKNTTALTTIELPEGLEKIEGSAFQASGLTSVTIPASVKTVAYQAFAQSALQSVTISGADTVLFDNTTRSSSCMGVFDSCTSLTEVNLPEGMKVLGGYAFYGCTALESVKLPTTLELFGTSYGSFEGSGLTSITIPASVTKYGMYAFRNCKALETVTLLSTADIGSGMFTNCTKLTTVSIPDGLKKLGYQAFEGCTLLENVKLPSSVVEINGSVFKGCTSIESIVIPKGANLPSLSTFSGWTADQTINIEATELEASVWHASWNKDCNANIVWEYVAPTV